MKEPLLPLYIKQSNRRCLSATSNFNIKWLVTLLLAISSLAIYVLLINLPTDAQKVDLQQFFIPEVNQHHHDQQQPPPPIERLNEKENVDIHTEPPKPPVTTTPDLASQRREKVKQMMVLSWKNYEAYAWGQNELKPISKTGHSAGIFGSSTRLGATIVDALDTLHIMGLMDEFKRGRDWVDSSFHFENIDAEVSAFEINIRFIGGLLSAYALSNDKMFLDKALSIADALMPIFDSPTGIPSSLINPFRKSVQNYNWASGGCSILAEIGTLKLEFEYLSDLSGKPIYANKVRRIQTVLSEVTKDNGIYYNYINPKTGRWCMNHASVGALGDSFYEYLFKGWLYSNKKDDVTLKLYVDAIEAIRKYMVQQSQGGLTFIGEFKGVGRIDRKMDHLACFTGGLFAITAKTVPLKNESDRQYYLELGQNITHTCHESYIRTATHIGPEAFHFERVDSEAQALRPDERYYILRPEVVESYFYLWRLTKDNKYREWAWDAVEALEKHCKTDNGYSGIRDVTSPQPAKDDVQQSFFLAETLKYLYLIFCDDDVIPLDKYVFNTEAHPFPIKNTN